MPNRNKQKGDRFESAALLTAREYFPTAKRTRAGWDDDRGDILLDPYCRFIVQVKDCQVKPWFTWIDQLDAQIANANAQHGVIAVKRVGVSDAGEAMAFGRFRDWLRLAAQVPPDEDGPLRPPHIAVEALERPAGTPGTKNGSGASD
jgi:hypothetical protein